MSESENNLPTLSQSSQPIPEAITILIFHDFLATAETMANGHAAIATVLDEAGFTVNWQQATTVQEYCDRLNSELDLILWDAHQTQLELTEAINLLSRNNLNTPLVVINGEPDTSAIVAAIKVGATDYLTSEELDRLPVAVKEALDESKTCSRLAKCTAQSERQLQKLITENADGIIVVNERGVVQFVNPAALELFSKSQAELIGEPLGFPVVNGDYLEVDIPQCTQEILVAQMRVSQIQWQGADAYIVSLRDITQLKQAEEERVKLLKEAQAANRAKDEFLAVLSHELRTPLNPIVGWSQMLAKGNLSPTQIQKGAKIIQRNAELQTQLIEDILDISRIIRGKLELQVAPVNLATVINNAIDTVNLAAEAKSIQINTNLDPNIGLVRGDSTRLQQAIWNLLSNAVKFTPDGGKVDVNLTTVGPENRSLVYARIQIKDSGKGIDSEFLPHIFDYFRQAESSKNRSEGGLGLGLAIVRRLVELHGGKVTATSAGLGKGATFTILLPILKTSQKKPSRLNRPQSSKNFEEMKILIVDDNESSRELLILILETEGAETKTTASAAAALAIVEQFQPDLLISDIGMPGMNGYELIQRVREISSVKDIKAIALTAYASEPDRQKSLAAGFDDHINKPLDVSNFIKVITHLLKI